MVSRKSTKPIACLLQILYLLQVCLYLTIITRESFVFSELKLVEHKGSSEFTWKKTFPRGCVPGSGMTLLSPTQKAILVHLEPVIRLLCKYYTKCLNWEEWARNLKSQRYKGDWKRDIIVWSVIKVKGKYLNIWFDICFCYKV